ncbi:MAG TPA: amino acid adenylation domain-containing protein, partial [Thermoanaerobaculia bacterium]|nr:amino acid adenylation domain-containing protein [Thermoanaerobaculia bacterium]
MPPESSTPVLSEAKRRLLEQRLRGRGAAAPAAAIPRRPDPRAPAPLSFGQQRLWFLDRLYPGSAAYNLPKVIRVEGDLDAALLERVLGEIVRRHEILRTTLPLAGGNPVQVVAPPARFRLPRVDLRGLPAARRQATARGLATAEGRAPFDLEKGPLWRARLIALAAGEHVVLLTLHHTVSDGWSSGVLVRELAALYRAFAAGAPSPLPELPVQYADFAAWERRWLTGEVLRARTAYWRTALDGVQVLDLPTDRPASAEAGLAGHRLSFELPAALSGGLKALALSEGVTPFVLLLAAYKVLLLRYTRQEDVCVGSPTAGRHRGELEPLIGFFVNTLALRTRLSLRAGFREVLAGVRQTVLGAQEHQELPFDKLVEELAPDRSLAHAPLFNVMFSLLTSVGESLELPGLRFTPLEVESRTAKFDLTLAMIERGGRFAGSWEYRTDLFDAATLERAAGHWAVLLAGLVASPATRLCDLPLLTPAERQQLRDWGRGPSMPPGDEPPPLVQQAIARRAARAPDAVAVAGGGEHLTYGGLLRAADELAGRLGAAGVGLETVVALAVERSPALVVGLLGILRAGGVYLPLDPALPAERLTFLLADSGAAVLLTADGAAPPWAGGVPVLPLAATAGAERTVGGSPLALSPPVLSRSAEPPPPDALAYVIYTSGSTGKPKGVGVPHGAAAAHCRAVAEVYGLGPGDRVLQFASPSFDVSLEQILPALAAGARLVLREPDVLAPVELSDWMARQGLTVANLPTALWHRWVDDPRALATAPRSLRLVMAGGEEMLAAGVASWHRSPLAGARLLNAYGPTEAVITATLHPPGGDGSSRVPVGRPLAARSARVVDRSGGPVPAGVAGELLLGGVLARGYLGRRRLTAERFVPDPDGAPGERLYRSGDLARWRPDGALDFLGRGDHQVKIRGFRIELGEIEAVLARHPAVREAVVVAAEQGAGDRRLVAYVSRAAIAGTGAGAGADAGGAASAEGRAAAAPSAAGGVPALRAWLREHLPEHMVPAAIVVLDALPLTATGKVDRRALPAPEAPAVDRDAEGPVSPVAELLQGIWGEILGIDR